MRFNRIVLFVFAALDALLLARLFQSIVPHVSSGNYASLPWQTMGLLLLRSAFLLSLAVSAFGLARGRVWGLVLSYVQFPFRFVFVLLSFGFLRWIFGPLQVGNISLVIVAAMVLEVVRLVLTILIHVRLSPKKQAA